MGIREMFGLFKSLNNHAPL